MLQQQINNLTSLDFQNFAQLHFLNNFQFFGILLTVQNETFHLLNKIVHLLFFSLFSKSDDLRRFNLHRKQNLILQEVWMEEIFG